MAKKQEQAVETPEERALRLTEKLRGLLKDEIQELGGAEGFLNWVRYGDDEPTRLRVVGMAKSTNPDYEAVKVYLPKQIRRDAWRKWEDESGGDFSDLVEYLLHLYVNEKTRVNRDLRK